MSQIIYKNMYAITPITAYPDPMKKTMKIVTAFPVEVGAKLLTYGLTLDWVKANTVTDIVAVESDEGLYMTTINFKVEHVPIKKLKVRGMPDEKLKSMIIQYNQHKRRG